MPSLTEKHQKRWQGYFEIHIKNNTPDSTPHDEKRKLKLYFVTQKGMPSLTQKKLILNLRRLRIDGNTE